MPDRIRLSRFVSVGCSAPEIADLDWMQRHGFRAVLDLRTPQDHPDPLPPEAESATAATRGLAYSWFPIPATEPSDDLIDQFGAVLKRLPKPVFVHCTDGRRAGMFALTQVALEQGIPGRTMHDMARRLGVLYGDRHLQARFADYIDRQSGQPDPAAQRARVLHSRGRPQPLLVPEPHASALSLAGSQPMPPRVTSRQTVNATALAVAGTVCGMVLDDRFLAVPLLTLGFLAARLMLPRPSTDKGISAKGISTRPSTCLPRQPDEVDALRGRLQELQTA